MLFCVVIVALLGVHLTVAQSCVQDRFNTRNEYELDQNDAGFDVTLWHRDGLLLLGQLAGSGVADPALGTLTLTGPGQSLSSTTSITELADLESLENDGDQHFIIMMDLAQASTAVEPVDDNCLITVGGGETSPGFCLAANGQLRFPDRFALKPTGAVGGAAVVAVHIRRFALGGEIFLDFDFNVGGTTTSFANQKAEIFEIGTGLTIESPPADTVHTITQIIVLEGRERAAGEAAGFFAGAVAALGDKGQCRLQQWSTSTPFVVPGSGDGNLVLTLTTTNFGPDDLVASTGDVQFLPDDALEFSNFTNVAVTGATFNVTAFSGELTTGGALAIDALTVGSSYTFTFTATVFNCSATALPLVDSGIVVDGSEADIYVQREALLELIEVDQRPFDLQNLPIAVGCDVPFAFTEQVFNQGPSCVENLVLQPTFFASSGITIEGGDTPITAERIFPQEERDGAPVQYTIAADSTAGNIREEDRQFALNGPFDGGVTSAFVTEPVTDEPAIGSVPNFFDLTYDVTRYADLSVDVSFDQHTAQAGVFASPTTPNLIATVSVKNGACVAVSNIVIAVQIDLPSATQYLKAPGNAITDATTHELIEIASLDIDETQTFQFNFAVCSAAKFSNAGVTLSARVQSAGASSDDGTNGPSERETKQTVLAAGDYGENGVVLIRRFDDSCDKVAHTALQADVSATLTCDEPVLIASYRNDEVEKEPVRKSAKNKKGGKDDDDEKEESHHGKKTWKRSASWKPAAGWKPVKPVPHTDDVDLQKVTRCRVTVDNFGASDVSLKVLNNWDLPAGSRLARWATSAGQFVDGVWALRAGSQSTVEPDIWCAARSGAQATLELDFVSTKPGVLQIVSRVDEGASAADLSNQKLGNAVTIDV